MTRPDFDAVVAGTGTRRHAVASQEEAPTAPVVDLRHLLTWVGPIAVTVLAAVLRLWNLGTPATLVFDETYYVKDAWTMLHLGYEGQWPEDANTAFNAGDVDGFTTEGEYVAHPPLGKWIIALGLRLLGAGDPVGWRLSTAVVGILAVSLVCVIALLLFRSSLLATIAGGLMAVDGLAIVLSRTALLDNFLMFLVLLAFTAVLLDRSHSAKRLARWMTGRADAAASTDWGPAIWRRPWLLTAGVLLGLATAVKWSGVFFLAAFAVYTLAVDAVARRRAGVRFWASSTLLRQAPVTFLLTVPTAAIAYLVSWTGWFVTDGGYDRQWASSQAGTGATVPWLPGALQSFWHYQVSMYTSNITLTTPHGFSANPLTWLLLARPTALYYVGSERGENGCDFETCSEYVTSLANPLLWWASVIAALYLVARLVRHREWQVGLILTGVGAGYLPWLLYTERTVFQFYTIAFLPYLVLGLTFVIGLLLDAAGSERARRRTRSAIVVFLGAVLAVSIFFYPAWTGMRVSGDFQIAHYWLPGWR